MKGVTFVRVKFHPEAACGECGWACTGSRLLPPVTVRSRAERHVRETGHRVRLDITDRTEYEPADGAS